MTENIIDAVAGVVRCEHKRAAIIGAGSACGLAPWDDDSWCFFAINEIAQEKTHRHFELHPRSVQSVSDLAWLKTCPVPCYVLDIAEWRVGEIPHAVQYPLERVLERTGGRRYATCTFAYQAALALAEGFEEIGLWGVDLSLGTARERLVEAPCVEYWLGLAEGRGVKVTLPPGATLLRRDYLYGYQYDEEKRRIEEVCREMLLTIPPHDWPALLQRLGRRYGGRRERALVALAAELGRAD